MANSLYQAILDKIRRVTKPTLPNLPGRTKVLGLKVGAKSNITGTNIIPFAPGRIYRTIYTNYKTDPRPLIFILYSNAFYTHAINIHYLSGYQQTMMRMILLLRDSGKPLTGSIIYEFLKLRAPIIPKLGYRMYFTKYLSGKLVSDGVSQIPLPGKDRFFFDPFIKQIESQIKPKVVEKTRIPNSELRKLEKDLENARIKSDIRYTKR